MFTYPFEVIRTRISLEQGKGWDDRLYKKFGQTWKMMNRNEGRKSVYRGFILSNVINLPYTLTFLLSYEMFKEMNNNDNKDNNQMFLNVFGVVSLCGFLAQSVVYPMDTIR